MEYQDIAVDRRGAVQWVRLNRPERHNAQTGRMWAELEDAFVLAGTDDEVRAVVLTGAGSAFSVGFDLADEDAVREFGSTVEEMTESATRGALQAVVPIVECPVPVVAAVNGVAAGGGVALALACDFVIASDRARFASSFIRIALSPDLGVSWLLLRRLRYSDALGFLLAADPVGADRARELGLVSSVVPHDRLEQAVQDLGERYSALAPGAVAATKSILRLAGASTLEETICAESAAAGPLAASDDYAEGVAAFFEKRTPVFRGR
jgi:2-(1,2-epoxy-1,2-dihydrophenyl)acetyl-CoA isomerase